VGVYYDSTLGDANKRPATTSDPPPMNEILLHHRIEADTLDFLLAAIVIPRAVLQFPLLLINLSCA